MSTNPYQTPSGMEPSVSDASNKELLRTVARNQKHVLYALLATIFANVLSFIVRGMALGQEPNSGTQFAAIAVGILSLAIAVFAIVSVYRLSASLGTNPVLAVLAAICVCIPCVSLIVILIVNQQATSLLQRNGIKVSLMGADPDSIQ